MTDFLIDFYDTRLELLIQSLILHSTNAIEYLPSHYVLNNKLSLGYTVINKAYYKVLLGAHWLTEKKDHIQVQTNEQKSVILIMRSFMKI